MFLCHPIYLTKCSNCAFHYNVGALSTHPTAAAAATFGDRNSHLWYEPRKRRAWMLEREVKNWQTNYCARIWTCQNISDEKISAKYVILLKLVCLSKTQFLTQPGTGRTQAHLSDMALCPVRIIRYKKLTESEKLNTQLCCPLLCQAGR